MPRQYRPRRASKFRWLNGAPDYILDVFDNKGQTADRYTVFFCAQYLIWNEDRTDYERMDCRVPYLGMSDTPTHPQGVSMWGEMRAHEVADYRYRNGHRRIQWLDLPEHIREHVIARAGE